MLQVNEVNDGGVTALDRATERGHQDIVTLLTIASSKVPCPAPSIGTLHVQLVIHSALDLSGF